MSSETLTLPVRRPPAPVVGVRPVSPAGPLTASAVVDVLLDQFFKEVDERRREQIPCILRSAARAVDWRARARMKADLLRLPDRVDAGAIWDAIQRYLPEEKQELTQMTREAKIDLFMGDQHTGRTTLARAMEGAISFLILQTTAPELYDFDSYRKGKYFYKPPTGFLAQQKNSTWFKTYFRSLNGGQNSAFFTKMLRQARLDSGKQARFERLAEALVWARIVKGCVDRGQDPAALTLEEISRLESGLRPKPDPTHGDLGAPTSPLGLVTLPVKPS